MDPSDFDMKARNAGENNFFPFEEGSWDKIELLLDKHLPQKKEKRRFLFWWLVALMPIGLVAGYWFVTNYSKTTDKKQNYTVKKIEKQSANTNLKNPLPGNNMMLIDSYLTSKKEHKSNTVLFERLQVADQKNYIPVNQLYNKVYKRSSPLIRNNKNLDPSPEIVTLTNKDDNAIASKTEDPLKENYENAEIISKESIKDTAVKRLNIKDVESPTDRKRNKTKGQFYLAFSTGIESSGTGITTLGAGKPLNGVGIQYAKNNVFFRTGLLVTRKIYTAKDKDYNRKSGTWMSVVTFDNIVADCKVIEIPLSMGYTFINNKKTNVYITAGTSAYFMKKEDYQFYFKNTLGNDTTRNANFTNNSNHYFSSINFSAGIEQKISNRFSLMAEPTVKLPVGGIGSGKIKLYGAGVLVTAKIRLK